jgi:hypothetical protein
MQFQSVSAFNGARMHIRTKWTDPDFRKTPKTDFFCILCQRDLKPNQSYRMMAVNAASWEAIHRDDWEKAEPEFIEFYTGPVGSDCARRIGLEFSREVKK